MILSLTKQEGSFPDVCVCVCVCVSCGGWTDSANNARNAWCTVVLIKKKDFVSSSALIKMFLAYGVLSGAFTSGKTNQ